MGAMRRYLIEKQEEMKELKLQSIAEKRVQAIQKVASMKHHLVGTKSIDGVCASRKNIPKDADIDMQLTDAILLESAANMGLKEKVLEQIKTARKNKAQEVVPESEKAKLAQGPFLVCSCCCLQ
jgi:paraquat-inducible protein B